MSNRELVKLDIDWHASKPMSKKEIDFMRLQFWKDSSQFRGRKEIWDAIKHSLETADLEVARATLESLNASSVNGTLENIEDWQGWRYILPKFCVSYPDNTLI